MTTTNSKTLTQTLRETVGTPEWALEKIMHIVCTNPWEDYATEREDIAKILATVAFRYASHRPQNP